MLDTALPVREDLPNIKLQPNQNARAYGESCMGCQATRSEVMLAFGGTMDQPLLLLNGNNQAVATAKKLQILDIFLSRSQAEALYKELGSILGVG